tara:strand:+ start:678 stop:1334 length:657 start_codon:yes stop_codon:yes gene_type:complete
MNDPKMWPLDKGAVTLVGRSLDEWEEELGQTLEVIHSWDLLTVNEEILFSLEKEMEQDPRSQYGKDGKSLVGKGTEILPGVYVEGRVAIGRNCKIGPNCYLRGSTTIGDGCHIGQAVEIKNSIIGSNTSVGHLSYLGDSILGEGVNFGAGTITANLRHDGGDHRSMVEGKAVTTSRRKLGVIIGDAVHTGIHTSFYPGRKMAAGTSTLPGEIVQKDIQ